MSRSGCKDVVLISLDSLRYDCVGAFPQRSHLSEYGLKDELHTPNLDAFLEESVYFTEALSPAPVTTSAHASVMTGLYPAHHGARALFSWAVAEHVGTLAEQLRARGYATVAVLEGGQVNVMKVGTGVLKGFDTFFTDEVEACRYCASLDRPVLLFMHTWDIHMPYCWSLCEEARARDTERKRAQAYICRLLGIRGPAGDDQAMQMEFWHRACVRAREVLPGREATRLFFWWYAHGVNAFDSARWPRIIGALRGAGLYDNAMTIIFGDHGEALLPDWPGEPMSHLFMVLEDAIRVPLVMRAPGLAPRVADGQASLLDITPTVLDYLGINSSAIGRDGVTDGRSLLPLAAGADAPGGYFISEAWAKNSMLSPAQKETPDLADRASEVWVPSQSCIRTADIKLLWHPALLRLARYQAAQHGGRLMDGLRTAVRDHFPGMLAGLRSSAMARARAMAGRLSGAAFANPARWHTAPLFVLDLKSDLLEEHPRPLDPAHCSPQERALLRRLREYWESGVLGPRIDVSAVEREMMTRRLQNLGYA